MGLFDGFTSGESSKPNSAHGVNDIPPPRSDASVNAPPLEQHRRVADFVKVSNVDIDGEMSLRKTMIRPPKLMTLQEAPTARYTFDSRRNAENPEAELCRINQDGGKSCIKLFLTSASLFKSMQSLDYFCALPAEPQRTYMECTKIPR